MLGMLLLFHSTLFEICVDFILISYRMKGNKAKQIKQDAIELEQGIHLFKDPLAMQEEPDLMLSTKAEKGIDCKLKGIYVGLEGNNKGCCG